MSHMHIKINVLVHLLEHNDYHDLCWQKLYPKSYSVPLSKGTDAGETNVLEYFASKKKSFEPIFLIG